MIVKPLRPARTAALIAYQEARDLADERLKKAQTDLDRHKKLAIAEAFDLDKIEHPSDFMFDDDYGFVVKD